MLSGITHLFHKNSKSTTKTSPIINENNFIILRLWKPKFKGTETNYPRAILGEGTGKDAAVGHISIEIFIDHLPSVYFSHWPDFEIREQRAKDPQNKDKVDVGKNNDLEYDIKNEGGLPDDYIILHGLDVKLIKAAAEAIGKQCPWTIKGEKSDFVSDPLGKKPKEKSYSCSSYVHELLKMGGIFDHLVPNFKPLPNPITPIDVAKLAKKACDAENKQYPQVKSFKKELSKIKGKIPVTFDNKLKLSEIDYASLYYKNNPEDKYLLNNICKGLNEFYTSQLLHKVKISNDLLSQNLKRAFDLEISTLVERAGANPLTPDEEGNHSLFYAVINRNYNCLKSILNLYPNLVNITIDNHAGSVENTTKKVNDSAFTNCESTKVVQRKNLLDLATELGHSEIESLLIKFGAKRTSQTKNVNLNSYHLNLFQKADSVKSTIQKFITKLVFSGGGAAGYAYAGAIAALEEEPSFSFEQLDSVAGTSIGGIAALMLSLKYKPSETSHCIGSLDLQSLKDGGNYIKQAKRLIHNHGRFQGKNLEEFIKSIIKGKIPTERPEDVTFQDLKALGYNDLYVIAAMVCKVNGVHTLKPVIFSAKDTPLTSVVSAVHASAAAPVYFASVKMKQIASGHYIEADDGFEFIDGGLLNNYCIDIFDTYDNKNQKIYNPHVLGFALLDDSQIQEQRVSPTLERINNKKKIHNAVDTTRCIVEGTLFESERQKLLDPNNLSRTVQINRLNVQLSDFDIGAQTIANLFESGKEAVKKYFSGLTNKTKKTVESNSVIYSNAKKEVLDEHVSIISAPGR